MQGRGLARPGRPHAQDEPVGFGDDGAHLAQIALAHAHFVEGNGLGRGQDAHDHVFVAVHRGQRGDAQLDGPVAHAELDLAVLGLALFRDVEPGHDLVDLVLLAEGAERDGSGRGRNLRQNGVAGVQLAVAHRQHIRRGSSHQIVVLADVLGGRRNHRRFELRRRERRILLLHQRHRARNHGGGKTGARLSRVPGRIPHGAVRVEPLGGHIDVGPHPHQFRLEQVGDRRSYRREPGELIGRDGIRGCGIHRHQRGRIERDLNSGV